MRNFDAPGLGINGGSASALEVRNSTPGFHSTDILKTTSVIGDWQLDGVRAVGSSAVLLDGHNEDGDKAVLKVGFHSGPAAIAHARREVALTQRIADVTSHVATIIEAGVETLVTKSIINNVPVTNSGEYPVAVMEPVEGPTLSELVKTEGPLSPQRTAMILTPVAQAFDAIHGEGYIHRDGTTNNVIVSPKRGAVLLDFDTAVPVGAPADLIGTPGSVSPEEQRLGEPLTEKVDTWKLGATAFSSMSGGEHLIPGETVLANTDYLADKTVYKELIHEQVSQFPVSVQVALLRALAYDPTERPTATEFVADLAAANKVRFPRLRGMVNRFKRNS